MNTADFLKLYRPQIRTWFNDNVLLHDNTTTISEGHISSTEISTYYVPRYAKDDTYDQRSIELQITDSTIHPVTVATAVLDPKAWDLLLSPDILPQVNRLQPVPIATDRTTGKSILLDSNHTIVSLLYASTKPFTVPIVRIEGTDLSRLVIDFRLINR